MRVRQFFRKLNYRHYICVVITIDFALCGVFLFRNAFGRLIEAGRDFGLSIAYYFCRLFGIPYGFTPTVNDFPAHAPPDVILPQTWEGFQTAWSAYWTQWATWENFLGYLNLLGNIAKVFIIASLPVLGGILLLRRLMKRYLKKVNNDYGKETRPLKAFKRVSDYTYRPVRIWLIGFIAFVRENSAYWKLWLCMWLFYFNGFTIILEFFAWYFYFVLSFDVANIYRQLYKLCVDLSVPFGFIPWWVWLVGAVWLVYRLSIKRGYAKLYHHERRNRGFLNERGVLNTVFAAMGAGKTLFMVDAALSYEVQILDDALEVILETDMHFPFFTWCNLREELKRAIEWHIVYDVWSARRWVRKKRQRWEKGGGKAQIFGYDFERYGLYYDNNLYLQYVWDAIEDYARAYLIYTVQSSYLIANFSIRSDKLISDLGNFPLWDTDFFKRDSRLIDSFSRNAHILDFDMLRLGKQMLQDNPNRNAFGFGVYVITEVDKERKNTPELQEVKRNVDEANQKNDLFNVCLKMSRHACVVANRVFVHILVDLQRRGSLNSDMLELGDTLEIRSKDKKDLVLPWWSPFWLVELLASFLIGKFDPFYLQAIHARSDSNLFMYFLKNPIAALAHYRERIYNLFCAEVLTLRVERGTKDGDFKDCKWFRQSKKVFARRYETDCVSAMYEARGELNTIGIDDLQEYATLHATNDERDMQHSYMQNDVNVLSAI